MKKITRILSVALVALMVMSLSAMALAEDTAVFIPSKLAKLGDVPTIDDVEDKVFYLSTKTESVPTYGNPDNPYDPCPILAVEDADIDLWFTDANGNPFKPDWAGVNWAEGWENLEIDEDGHAQTSMEGHIRQPGTWVWNNPDTTCDPLTGEIVWREDGTPAPDWCHQTGGDYPYSAGKTYEDGTEVKISFGRNGTISSIEYVMPETDFFRTGFEGATTTVKFDRVTVASTSATARTGKIRRDTYFYTFSVCADYPAGNPIVRVETEWRNDAKQNLATYRISFAPTENEVYKITYAPNTVTMLENHLYSWPSDKNPADAMITKLPGNMGSMNIYTDPTDPTSPVLASIHHYTGDEVVYGEYYKNGSLKAVSGSGNNLGKWYKPGHGKQVKGIKYPCTYFKSPRVK